MVALQLVKLQLSACTFIKCLKSETMQISTKLLGYVHTEFFVRGLDADSAWNPDGFGMTRRFYTESAHTKKTACAQIRLQAFSALKNINRAITVKMVVYMAAAAMISFAPL